MHLLLVVILMWKSTNNRSNIRSLGIALVWLLSYSSITTILVVICSCMVWSLFIICSRRRPNSLNSWLLISFSLITICLLVVAWAWLERIIILQRLRRTIFSIFTESNRDAFRWVAKSEATYTIHCILRALIVFVVHESNSLTIFVSCKSDFIKTSKTLKNWVEFFFCYILGNITDIETNISFSLAALVALVLGCVILVIHNLIYNMRSICFNLNHTEQSIILRFKEERLRLDRLR